MDDCTISGGLDAASALQLQRCITEQKLLEAVDCRHLVQLHGLDFTEAPARTQLLKLCAGGNLRDAIATDGEKRYRWENRGKFIALDILFALCSLHSHGLCHGTVSSVTVWLTEAGDALLTTPGVTTLMMGEDTTADGLSPWALLHSAPEAVLGACRPMSDIFSFGLLLHMLVVGESAAMASSVSRSRPAPPGCPPEVWAVIQDCCENRPSRRPTAEQCLQRLLPSYGPDGGDHVGGRAPVPPVASPFSTTSAQEVGTSCGTMHTSQPSAAGSRPFGATTSSSVAGGTIAERTRPLRAALSGFMASSRDNQLRPASAAEVSSRTAACLLSTDRSDSSGASLTGWRSFSLPDCAGTARAPLRSGSGGDMWRCISGAPVGARPSTTSLRGCEDCSHTGLGSRRRSLSFVECVAEFEADVAEAVAMRSPPLQGSILLKVVAAAAARTAECFVAAPQDAVAPLRNDIAADTRWQLPLPGPLIQRATSDGSPFTGISGGSGLQASASRDIPKPSNPFETFALQDFDSPDEAPNAALNRGLEVALGGGVENGGSPERSEELWAWPPPLAAGNEGERCDSSPAALDAAAPAHPLAAAAIRNRFRASSSVRFRRGSLPLMLEDGEDPSAWSEVCEEILPDTSPTSAPSHQEAPAVNRNPTSGGLQGSKSEPPIVRTPLSRSPGRPPLPQ